MYIAERLTEPCAYHGEGPFWDERRGRLLFLDVLAGDVLDVDASGSVLRYRTPSRVATVIRRRKSGGFVIGTDRGVVAANEALSEFWPIAEFVSDPGCRTNDGGCDPRGGFVIGSMAEDGRPGGGTVYRVGVDHTVVELVSPVSISNGVQWSRDGKRVFYVDSPTRRVDAFDFDVDTGAWSGRRLHIEIDAYGVPDGMAIDEEDGLWIAIWGGGAVNHYDASGKFVQTVRIPGVSQTSSCCFGGSQRNMLYVTTSREGLSECQERDAGSIFACEIPSRGAVLAEFAG
jgi:sugar lactone lactonase YvrE